MASSEACLVCKVPAAAVDTYVRRLELSRTEQALGYILRRDGCATRPDHHTPDLTLMLVAVRVVEAHLRMTKALPPTKPES